MCPSATVYKKRSSNRDSKQDVWDTQHGARRDLRAEGDGVAACKTTACGLFTHVGGSGGDNISAMQTDKQTDSWSVLGVLLVECSFQ